MSAALFIGIMVGCGAVLAFVTRPDDTPRALRRLNTVPTHEEALRDDAAWEAGWALACREQVRDLVGSETVDDGDIYCA